MLLSNITNIKYNYPEQFAQFIADINLSKNKNIR